MGPARAGGAAPGGPEKSRSSCRSDASILTAARGAGPSPWRAPPPLSPGGSGGAGPHPPAPAPRPSPGAPRRDGGGARPGAPRRSGELLGRKSYPACPAAAAARAPPAPPPAPAPRPLTPPVRGCRRRAPSRRAPRPWSAAGRGWPRGGPRRRRRGRPRGRGGGPSGGGGTRVGSAAAGSPESPPPPTRGDFPLAPRVPARRRVTERGTGPRAARAWGGGLGATARPYLWGGGRLRARRAPRYGGDGTAGARGGTGP